MTDELIKAAQTARGNAYAPYSQYKVGAAALDENGRISTGCNVENSSYGMSMCAERNAIAALVNAGGKMVRAVVIATQDSAPPCGACLQVISEFVSEPDVCAIIMVGHDGAVTQRTLRELLPFSFRFRKSPSP